MAQSENDPVATLSEEAAETHHRVYRISDGALTCRNARATLTQSDSPMRALSGPAMTEKAPPLPQ
jgi:hypothetical protein